MKRLLTLLGLVLVVACGAPPEPAPSKRPVLGGVFGGGGGPPDMSQATGILAEANGGTGTASFPGAKGTALTFSFADYGQGRADTWLNADYTVGIKFTPMATGVTIKGVRFWYDEPGHSARAIKVAIVDITGSSLIEAKTSTSLTAGAIYEVDFASTHALTAFNDYAVTVRSTTGIFAAFDSGSGLGPGIMNTSFAPTMYPWRIDGHVAIGKSCVLYTTGDNPAGVAANNDTVSSRIVPIEPVFQ